MLSLEQFQGYLSNTLGVASKFLQICQTMPWLSYNLITVNVFNNKNSRPIVHFSFWYIFIQLQIFFSNKNIKNNILKFFKLMISMLQMHNNAPNCMYIFQIFFGDDTPWPPFGAETQIRAPLQNSGCAQSNAQLRCFSSLWSSFSRLSYWHFTCFANIS